MNVGLKMQKSVVCSSIVLCFVLYSVTSCNSTIPLLSEATFLRNCEQCGQYRLAGGNFDKMLKIRDDKTFTLSLFYKESIIYIYTGHWKQYGNEILLFSQKVETEGGMLKKTEPSGVVFEGKLKQNKIKIFIENDKNIVLKKVN